MPRAPRTAKLSAVPDDIIPERNPIPEPKKVSARLIEAQRTLATNYAAAYEVLRHIKADLDVERARIRELIRQHKPDWTFTTTGELWPVSRQIIKMATRHAHSVIAYIKTLSDLTAWLDELQVQIEGAHRFHARDRALAGVLQDLGMLEAYWEDFEIMKGHRSTTLGQLLKYERTMPDDFATVGIIRHGRACVEELLAHDKSADVAQFTRFLDTIEAYRAKPYPINEEIGELEVLLSTLMPKGQRLNLGRLVRTGDELFTPFEIQNGA